MAAAGELPPHIGALLRMAWQQLHVEMYDRLHAAGFDDLRDVHRPLLRHPGIDGLRPSDLAVSLGVSRQHINDLLRDMEDFGYAHLEPDPDDKRARRIRYTSRGWRLLEAGSRISEEIGERWAAVIGRDDYERMLASLRTIVNMPVART